MLTADIRCSEECLLFDVVVLQLVSLEGGVLCQVDPKEELKECSIVDPDYFFKLYRNFDPFRRCT